MPSKAFSIIVKLKVDGNCIMATFPKRYKDMMVGTFCNLNENITEWVHDYLVCLGYSIISSKPYGETKLMIELYRNVATSYLTDKFTKLACKAASNVFDYQGYFSQVFKEVPLTD